jgi:solute carrier family 25 citrate transporter 1
MQLDKSKNSLGAINVVKETVRTNGPLGLYKGYTALLLFSVPKNQVRFGTFTYVQQHWLTEKNKRNTFLCGLIAGGAEALVVVTPQETLKTKLVHDKLSATPKYRGVFHGIYTISSQQGITGIYRAPLATFLKQSSNQGIRFVVFGDTQKFLQQYSDRKMVVDFFSGVFAGFCSSMGNNPVDVVKTKMQGVDAHKYNGFADCFGQIYKQHGFMGFYAGIAPRLVRVGLDVGLTFTIFGSLKRTVENWVASRM